jgi:ABC-type transport system involved in cytochrome bd biosynthesis fused ATPase/permease subunit
MVGLSRVLTAVTAVLMAGAVTGHPGAGGVSAPVAAMLVLGPLALGEVLGTLPDAMGALALGQAARARLARLLGQTPAVTEPAGTSAVHIGSDAAGAPGPSSAPGPAALALREVSASWDGVRDQIAGVELDVVPGERVALLGPNGVGKSTVLAVLARHLDPTGGRYTVAGREVRSLPLSDVRRRIALVDDEPHVFGGAVRANLLLAHPGAPDEAVRGALAAAGLGGWLAGLPDGLDTLLGTGGRGLSGGERARLAIARALLSGRPVLLLDEPVAHLDTATASAVLTDLAAAAKGRSVVVVSHQDLHALHPERTVRLGSGHHVLSMPS